MSPAAPQSNRHVIIDLFSSAAAETKTPCLSPAGFLRPLKTADLSPAASDSPRKKAHPPASSPRNRHVTPRANSGKPSHRLRGGHASRHASGQGSLPGKIHVPMPAGAIYHQPHVTCRHYPRSGTGGRGRPARLASLALCFGSLPPALRSASRMPARRKSLHAGFGRDRSSPRTPCSLPAAGM